EVAQVGFTEAQAKEKYGAETKVARYNFRASGRALALGESDGLMKVVTIGKEQRIIGVHIVGPQASELIAGAALAMRLEATVEDRLRDPASPIRVLRRCALRNPQLPGGEVLNDEREGRREDRGAPLEPDPVRASATTRRRRARDDLLECKGIRAEVIGEQREVGESAALRRDLPPAMAHRAVEVREGHDLEVAAVGEW